MYKQIKVWKVLRSKTRTSAGIEPNNSLSIYYPIGEFVKAKVGKIFCFLNKSDAVKFKRTINPRNRFPELSIHKAVAINVKPIYTMAVDSYGINKFWRGNPSGYSTPEGSYICDSIKCLD